MAAWTYVIMLILVVAIGIFVYLTFSTESKNRKTQQSNILYPFSGYLSPPNPPWTVKNSTNNPGVSQYPEKGLYLVGMVGGESPNVPQIQCPAGYKINIVAAYTDVVDPYGECSNTASSLLQMTCGSNSDPSSAPSCSSSDDCGVGMECYGQRCQPLTCTTHGDCSPASAGNTINACGKNFGMSCSSDSQCGDASDQNPGQLKCVGGTCVVDPGRGSCMACVASNGVTPVNGSGSGTCSFMPMCQGVTKGLNSTCSPIVSDQYKCRPRDASAYLSAHCDGLQQCLGTPSDIWSPNDVGNPFGPLPCNIPVSSSASSKYSSLPIIPGWGGGAPSNSSGSSDPATFNQGYYIHGIYTCIPDTENLKATSS